jgi:hypothetical protein
MPKIEFNQLLIYCSSEFLSISLPDNFFEMTAVGQHNWLSDSGFYNIPDEEVEEAWARIEASAYKLADFLESQGVTIIR